MLPVPLTTAIWLAGLGAALAFSAWGQGPGAPPAAKKPASTKPAFILDNARLSDPDPGVRSKYARAIARTGAIESIPTLEKLLVGDSSEMVRVNATIALSYIGRPEVEPSLMKAVQSTSVPVRVAGIRGLGTIASKSSFQTLIQTVGDTNAQIRRAALDSLGRRGDPAALSTVIRYVRDEDVAVAARAVWALGEFRDKAAVPTLIDVFKSSTPVEVRRESALALARIRDPQVGPTLTASALSREENLEVRFASIKGLTRMYPGDKEAVDLTALSNDENWQVRAASALAIATSDRGNVVAAMRVLLKDSQPAVRQSAVTAMGMRPARFSSLLTDVAVDRSSGAGLRILALTALSETPRSELGQDAILSKLRALLSTAEPVDLQVSGVKILAHIGSEPAKAAIRTFGNEPNLNPTVKAAIDAANR